MPAQFPQTLPPRSPSPLTSLLPPCRYYAWERYFEEHISSVRAQEMRGMFWNVVIRVINISE